MSSNKWRLMMYTLGAVVAIPFNILIENLAVIGVFQDKLGGFLRKKFGVIGDKMHFFIVQKERPSIVV